MGIYDLAGNEWEWTLEYTSRTSEPCAYRGGIYNYTGSGFPASSRVSYYKASREFVIGARVALY